MTAGGGRFDFDDGGTYFGGWEDGKAHGYGVCTGPRGQGEYAGAYHCGSQISGTYTWSSDCYYRGQWSQCKRHGVGIETKGRWIYEGEWSLGFKGRYGCRHSSLTGAKYEGTWTTGLHDGYGVETYADGGSYQGQWLRGIRHGYGVRQSVAYGLAAHTRLKAAVRESLTSLRSEKEDDVVVKERDRKCEIETRSGFVLTANSKEPVSAVERAKELRRGNSLVEPKTRASIRKTLVDGLKLKKQRSTGDLLDSSPSRHGGPRGSVHSDRSFGSEMRSDLRGSHESFIYDDDDLMDFNLTEYYRGEWKNDKRSGFGVAERSDGLKYEGEWENNQKHGYGATTLSDGSREEGKYKYNVLVSGGTKTKLMILRAAKIHEHVENAVTAAQRAAQIALQKSDIALSRMASAKAKAELAKQAAGKALRDSERAKVKAKEYTPEVTQPGDSKNHAPAAPPKFPLLGHLTGASSDQLHKVDGSSNYAHSTARALLSKVGLGGSSDTRQPGEAPMIGGALLSMGLLGTSMRPIGKDKQPITRANLKTPVSANLPSSLSTSPSTEPEVEYVEEYEVSDYVEVTKSQPAGTKPKLTAAERAAERAEKRAAARRDNNQFTALLTEDRIADHFDQYDTGSSDGSVTSRTSRDSTTPRPRIPFTRHSHSRNSSTSPDRSVNSASPQNAQNISVYPNTNIPLSRPIQRRKTLPPGDIGLPEFPLNLKLPPSLEEIDETTANGQEDFSVIHGSDISNKSIGNTKIDYSMQNGQIGGRGVPKIFRRNSVQRFVQSGVAESSGRSYMSQATPLEPVGSKFRRNIKSSMPNVSTVVPQRGGALSSTMPREEVHVLSMWRREEIRNQREDEERRKKQEVILRFTDIKDWCFQRQMLVFVLAFNVSLATVFFHMF